MTIDYQRHRTETGYDKEQAREQLSRNPRPLPKLTLLRTPDSILDYREQDIVIDGYEPHPHIKAPVAI